ncbi:MAG: TolC family protein [Acidobacteriaceae bacterium]
MPYPGKLRLRGDVARREADVMGVELDATEASVVDAVKADYIHLAHLQEELGILRENDRVLGQLIKDATAHYEVGQGSRADVLQAQVQRTKIVRKITPNAEERGDTEADLKALLHRDQGSPDIVAEELVENLLRYTSAELLQMVRKNIPQIEVDLSWSSSKLEGNTYSLLDTRRLIEFGEEAPGGKGLEAQMILNHKDAIAFLVSAADEIGFNRYTILNLHGILAQNLLPDEAAPGRLQLIAVGIEKSAFHPSKFRS